MRLMLDRINELRWNQTNGQFNTLGEILAVPEFSSASPYLRDPYADPASDVDRNKVLRDVDYERIPQQILSLLKVGEPRFVIYAWGQSLIPESVATGGRNVGMPINYRITGEIATRAVVRVDFDRFNDPTRPDYNKPDYSRPHLVVESFNVLPHF
jgi:hypothetical protein